MLHFVFYVHAKLLVWCKKNSMLLLMKYDIKFELIMDFLL